jgi:hypothetical protein
MEQSTICGIQGPVVGGRLGASAVLKVGNGASVVADAGPAVLNVDMGRLVVVVVETGTPSGPRGPRVGIPDWVVEVEVEIRTPAVLAVGVEWW